MKKHSSAQLFSGGTFLPFQLNRVTSSQQSPSPKVKKQMARTVNRSPLQGSMANMPAIDYSQPCFKKLKTQSEIDKSKAVVITQMSQEVSNYGKFRRKLIPRSKNGSVSKSLSQLSQISDQAFVNSLNNLKPIVGQNYTDLWARYPVQTSLEIMIKQKKAKRAAKFRSWHRNNTINTMNIEENINKENKQFLNDSLHSSISSSANKDFRKFQSGSSSRNEDASSCMQWQIKQSSSQPKTQVTQNSNSMSFADHTGVYTNMDIDQSNRTHNINILDGLENKNISFGKPTDYSEKPSNSHHVKKLSQGSDQKNKNQQIPFSFNFSYNRSINFDWQENVNCGNLTKNVKNKLERFERKFSLMLNKQFTQYNDLLKDVKVDSAQISLKQPLPCQNAKMYDNRNKVYTSKELIDLIGTSTKTSKLKAKEIYKLEQFRSQLMRQISFGQNLGQEFGLADINQLFMKKPKQNSFQSKDQGPQSPQSSASMLQSKTYTSFQNRKGSQPKPSQAVAQPIEIYSNSKLKPRKNQKNNSRIALTYSTPSKDMSRNKSQKSNRFRTKSKENSKQLSGHKSKQSETSYTLEVPFRSDSQETNSHSRKKKRRSQKSKDSHSSQKPIFKDILEIATYLRQVRKQKVKEMEGAQSLTEMRKQKKYTEVNRKQKSQSNQARKKEVQLVHPSSLPQKNSDVFSSCLDQLSVGSQPFSHAQLERGSAENFYDDRKTSFQDSTLDQMTFQSSVGHFIPRQGTLRPVRTGDTFFNRRKKTSSKNRDKMHLQIQNRKTVSGTTSSKWINSYQKPLMSPKQAIAHQIKTRDHQKQVNRSGAQAVNDPVNKISSVKGSMMINDRPRTTAKGSKKRRGRYSKHQNSNSGSEFQRHLASANSGREMLLLQNTDFNSFRNNPRQFQSGANLADSHTFYNNSSHNQTVNINIFVEPKKLTSPNLPSKVKQAVSSIKSNPYYHGLSQ